jgi:hypothetical protein
MEASGNPALIGTLSYRLPIPTASAAPTVADSSSSSFRSSQKKKRPRCHGDHTNGDHGSSFSIPTTAAAGAAGRGRLEPRLHRTGWVLNDTYMLSLAGAAADPQQGRLARLAATAFFHQWPVRIDSYYRHNDSIGGGLVEVQDLCLCKEEEDNNDVNKKETVDDVDHVNDHDDDFFFTLRQIARLERELEIENAAINRSSHSNDDEASTTTKQQQKTTTRTTTYSLRAVVAAISPIIVMDDNPFALMELCDDQNCHDQDDEVEDETEEYGTDRQSHRCVVVLRGPALVYAADNVLRVGEAVRFRNVRRQKWRIPTIVPMAPSHVFVLQQPHDDDDPSRHHSLLLSSSVHYYFWTGTIRSVHWLPSKSPGRGDSKESSSSAGCFTGQTQQQRK